MNLQLGDWLIITEKDDEKTALYNMISDMVFPLVRISDKKSDIFKFAQKSIQNSDMKCKDLKAVYLTYMMEIYDA